ncbi:Acyltransferase family protein [Lachnospiraceae bacterium XBB2008]|nr:Acyltransferase family protein [Lachnospiraceae bacterium XBB2008]
MSEENKKNHIDEISMMKGFGMLMVIFVHMSYIAGAFSEFEFARHLFSFIGIPVMMMFFYMSGYTSSTRIRNPLAKIGYRAGRILIPYYVYSISMLIIYAFVYLGIEKRSLAWFADGALGILFQLQSFHVFDPASAGVHPMFYGVLVGWFLFQMIVSEFVFTPIMYALKDKKSIWKLVTAIGLLAAGAILYKLNLQGLNGEYFPPVCKIFILPNIPGIAALMFIGSFMADHSVFDLDSYSNAKKAIVLIAGLAVEVIFFLTDDFLYDYPIGKWGPYGSISYFLAPFCGIGCVMFFMIICNLLKRFAPIKAFLMFMGDNSLDFLIMHFFVGVMTAYIGGFWYEYLYNPVPNDRPAMNYLHFVILIAVVFAVCIPVVMFKNHQIKKKA